MRKPQDIKKVHRFQSFSDRIQTVNVDVSRKIEKRSEVPEDEESFFEEGLLKWRDLNQTAHFTKFFSAVQGKTQTLAQLLYHEEEIVSLLLEHLSVNDSMALDALLDLVVQIARDLQTNFYPHFRRFFTVIASILNKFMKDWEVLEQAFTCLSYLFKFMWRKMVQDIDQVLILYHPLLSETNQNRDYVRRFAAESLSYIMRKTKDKKKLFAVLFAHLKKNPEMVLGIGGLIFEMVKGPKSFFHSCAEEVLTYLVNSLSQHTVSSLEFAALQETFNQLAEHVAQANTAALWSVLQNCVKTALVEATGASGLECITTIIFSMIDYKQGCLLPRPCSTWGKDTLLPLLLHVEATPAVEDNFLFVSRVLESLSSLLRGEKVKVDTATIVTCLNAIYCKQNVKFVSQIFTFTESLFSYSQFDKDVLRKLLEYCTDCLSLQQAEDSEMQVLAILTKLVLDRRPICRDGVYRPLNPYALAPRTQADVIGSCLLNVISSQDRNFDEIWAALTIIPHYTPTCKEASQQVLETVLSRLCQQLLTNESASCSQVAYTACQCLKSLLWVTSDGGKSCPVPVFDLLEKFPSHEVVLELCSTYLTCPHSNITNLLTTDRFVSIYPVLKDNISSHNSQVRRLTLRILSLFDVVSSSSQSDEALDTTELSSVAKESVFTVCLKSEEQHATLQDYREKLRLLRQLDYSLVNHHLPEDGTLDDVPLRYLTSVFYVNFSMLWPETITLIESHAASLDKKVLWDCYRPILQTAAKSCCNHVALDTADTCEESSPLAEIFSTSCDENATTSNDRVDYYNYRHLLWKAMLEFPKKCEQSSKAIVQLFFQFLEKEYYIAEFYDAPTEDVSRQNSHVKVDDELEEDQQETKKRSKIVYETFITMLNLFSKFKNPARVSEEQRLHKLYSDLLQHRDIAIQKIVLKCLMTYKKKQLLPYHENLENLLNDATFRNELTQFSIDSENSIVKEEHRPAVVPVLIRILYGRMLHSTGKETKGRGSKSDLRRTIVLSFLAGCREEELAILLDLVCEPVTPLLQSDFPQSLDLCKATPPKKVLGVLSTIVSMMEKLNHLMAPHYTKLLHLLLSLIQYAAFLLDEKRDQINNKTINSMKTARQTAIKCLAQFMDKNLEYIYTDAEMSRIFDVAVWPQLPRLSVEGTSAPTALLTLIHTWSSYRRYLPLMLKSSALHTDYPLSAVMKLLASSLCKVAVGTTIMNIIENILDFNSSTSTSMDVDNTLAIPVGEIIAVDDSAGSYEVGMLIPHLPIVISYIKDRVSKATIKGTNQNAFPMKELNILSVCSQYVDSPDLCTSLLSQLLPFLTSGSSRLSEEIQCGIVRTLGSLARKSDDVHKQLIKLLVLCSTLTLRLVRTEMVKMFDSLADISKECKEVAEFVREVNAFDRNRLEEPDYDSRLGAFREVVWWDYEKCPQSLLVAIIHNSYYTLRYVDDMALRDSSAATLQTLVKKMADVHYEVCVNSHLAPLVRIGIQLRKDTIRSEFIAVLRDMVNSKPDLYTDMVGLTNSDNIDDDFWENIRHIQVSRRLKGLNRLMRHLDTVQMKNTTLTKYLLPLVFSFIKDESEYNKKSAMVDVCIATVGALCKHLPWSAYKSQLKVSLSFLSKADKSKMAVRLICTILDSFHFDVSQSQYVETQVGKHLTTDTATSKKQKSGDSAEIRVAADEKPTEQPVLTLSAIEGAEASSMDVTETSEDVDEGIDMDSETQELKQVSETEGEGASVSTVIKCPPVLATSIHSYVIGSILPQLHQILSQKSSSDDQHKENRSLHPDQEEIQRVPLAIAIVKLLQKISSDTLGRHLPSVLAKVCYFLKSRAEDIRDAGRQTLAKILACLGLSYMPTITQQLKSTLVRGYQVYILAYSLHYILNQNIKIIKPGDLNSCLYDLVWINMNGLFGSSSQEKDIDKHDASKEKRKPPHFELFNLLARFVTPSTIAVILMPIKEKLDMIHKAKDMSKIRQCLDRIADGLLRNTGLLAQHYLKFTHSLISDSISQFFMDKRARQKAAAEAKRLAKEKEEVNLKYSKDTFIIPAEPGRSQPLPPTLKKSNKHVMVEFGMKLFHMLVKNAKILYNNEEHARMVDPFVQPFIEALTAENLPVINESLICLTFIIKFKGLPSLIDSMDKIISSLFLLLNTYSSSGVSSGESHELCQLCFRFISMVLKTCSYYQWTEDKIEVLLTYAEADILDHYKQATAFSLLKAIISRKLLCKLLYEVIKKVETLSITSESADVRLHCRQVVLQFLLDYPLGKGLPKHINFFLENLDYKAVHGRESIYEMLGAMLTAFPQKTVHMFSSLLFISLARARINDDSEKCRKLASLCVRTLLGRVERNCRNKLFDMAFTWLQEDRAEIVQMAAQVLGLFIVVECDSFSSRFPQLLTVLEKSLQPQIYVTLEGESDASKDLQLYNIILMVLKLIRECPQVLKQPIFDQILEHIRQHMLHPHAWVRLSTAQVFGLVFSTYNPDELVAAVLSQSYAHTAEVGESSHNSSEDRTSPSHREALTFLLTDTRQKLRDFTADFCTQLSSPYMTDEFASQIAKNLVFLVKVIRRLPESKLSPDSCVNPEDPTPADDCNDLAEADELANHSNKKKSVSVDWLIRRLGKVATFEATNAPRQTVKRTNVLKCLAAIAMELGPELLQQHLKNILPPIHRELNMVRLFPETEELRNLAGEVSNLLKDKVGVSTYSSVYASVHQASTMKKTERKRKLAQQAVVNPSIVANKKMKLHGKKGTSKRMSQKQSRFKGNKVVKRKRTVARDIAILQ